MDQRLNRLHYPLIHILEQSEPPGQTVLAKDRVYFQPPSSHTMVYPCFRYKLSSGNTNFADNKSYLYADQYDVIYITRKADTEDIRKLIREEFTNCLFDRRYTIDGLHHDSFRIYI